MNHFKLLSAVAFALFVFDIDSSTTEIVLDLDNPPKG